MDEGSGEWRDSFAVGADKLTLRGKDSGEVDPDMTLSR